jgi:hypothetical protein
MANEPRLPAAPIRRVPKAFLSWAQQHNQMLEALKIITRIKAGTGMNITWSQQDLLITNTRPDLPIAAGAGISVSIGQNVVITNLNP